METGLPTPICQGRTVNFPEGKLSLAFGVIVPFGSHVLAKNLPVVAAIPVVTFRGLQLCFRAFDGKEHLHPAPL